ncbi:MAG: hypothetical protein Q8P72_02275 [Candidatus Roizmanbacteria bacterium]|nr:hypothetical protein [Candidatus Roizmanbacteria bacterium]
MEKPQSNNENPKDPLDEFGKRTIGQEWWDFHNLYPRVETEGVGEYTERLRSLAIHDPTHFSGRVTDALLQYSNKEFPDALGTMGYVTMLSAVIRGGNRLYLDAREQKKIDRFTMEPLADVIVNKMRDSENQGKWVCSPEDLSQIQVVNKLLTCMCEHSRSSIFGATPNKFLQTLSDFSGNLISRFKSETPPPTANELAAEKIARQQLLKQLGLEEILEEISIKTSEQLASAKKQSISRQPDPGQQATKYKGHN